MYQSSHRLRVEEKRLYRRLLVTVCFIIGVAFLLFYAGLPILAKIIVTLSPLRRDSTVVNKTNSMILFPPVLDPFYEATNSGKITITGYADKEVTVKISVNGKDVTSVMTDNEGHFTAKNIMLTEGSNTIFAKTVKERSESSPSAEISIVYKKNEPKLIINNPKNNDKYSFEQKEIIIEGDTDPGNKVTINDRFVIVKNEGKFSFPVSLSEDENKFKIKASDNAGNSVETELKVFYSP